MVEPVLVVPATAEAAKPAAPTLPPPANPAPAVASTIPADIAKPLPQAAVEAPPSKVDEKTAPHPATLPAAHEVPGEPDKKPAADKKPVPDKKVVADKKPAAAKDKSKPVIPVSEVHPATPAPEAEKPSRVPRDK